MTNKRIIVIGSGFAGLSAASLLAKEGHNVIILEKNEEPGGRARAWKKDGFTFDMGPSWYWMPEVFEKFYRLKHSKAGGTGLGLSIVRGFIEAMKGTIRLDNLNTCGAKFTISIPAEMSYIKVAKHE